MNALIKNSPEPIDDTRNRREQLDDKTNHLTDRSWQKILTQKEGNGEAQRKGKKECQETAGSRSYEHRKDAKDLAVRTPLGASDKTKTKFSNRGPCLDEDFPQNDGKQENGSERGQ
jgi:hypothetical protein